MPTSSLLVMISFLSVVNGFILGFNYELAVVIVKLSVVIGISGCLIAGVIDSAKVICYYLLDCYVPLVHVIHRVPLPIAIN